VLLYTTKRFHHFKKKPSSEQDYCVPFRLVSVSTVISRKAEIPVLDRRQRVAHLSSGCFEAGRDRCQQMTHAVGVHRRTGHHALAFFHSSCRSHNRCGSYVVVRALDLHIINRSRVRLPATALSSSDPGRVVHTCPAPLKLRPYGAMEI